MIQLSAAGNQLSAVQRRHFECAIADFGFDRGCASASIRNSTFEI